MGRTYYKASKSFDDENSSKRSGKTARHANGKKTGGMRTLNNYVEEDYDFEDDVFDDEIEIDDNIEIQHTKHKP
jgi:hypothetical protein